MEPCYLLALVFEVQTPIRSLPRFHGARWSAWFRHACKFAQIPWETAFLGILPFRAGQTSLLPGDVLAVQLTLSSEGVALAPRLFHALLARECAHGEFSPRSLRLFAVRDAVGGAPLPLEDCHAAHAFTPATVTAETAALACCGTWHLRLATPLRLPLPMGTAHRGVGVKSYCPPEFFWQSADSLAHILRRVRQLPSHPVPMEARIVGGQLLWEDMRYSASREIALGGVMGEVTVQGELGAEALWRVVAGQYLGAGKNARFGLGHWRIPELDNVRTLALPPLRGVA